MNKILTLLILCLVFASCNKKDSEKNRQEETEPGKTYLPAFNENNKELSVKELPLQSKEDTVSYALGVAWANGIAKVGLYKLSYAFYLGVHDFMVDNPSFTTSQQAGERLDKEIDYLKQDTLPPINSDQKLKDIKLKSKYDTLSYQLGYSWTKGAKQYGIEKVNPTLLLGLTKGLKGDTSVFDYRKADRYLRGMVEKKREIAYSSIKTKNDQWLAENKNKKGVITLPDGVQYKVLANGKGKSPAGDEVVVIHYRAKTIDNTQFESTYEKGEPLKTYPTGIIPGLRTAVSRMKEGDRWEIYIPSKLGYGSGGVKDKVTPFATLIYEVELIKVEKGAF